MVMANSSWTIDHIRQLWNASRTRQRRLSPIEVVYPPVAVDELKQAVDVSRRGEEDRQGNVIYIAQFRPEKDHQLVLRAFARFLHKGQALDETSSSRSSSSARAHLTLIGSVRNSADETYIYSLRLLAHELQIKEDVTFLLNAPWKDTRDGKSNGSVLSHLGTASVGANAMWNEHFGIGVVEYQAAGLISVVHDSGGPRRDIVVDMNGAEEDGGSGPTGYRVTNEIEFADAFRKVLHDMNDDERWQMRLRARQSASRFSEDVFKRAWIRQMEKLIELRAA